MHPSNKPEVAVVALGGNALTTAGQQGTSDEIAANAAHLARPVAELVRSGRQVAVVHGNGPQVGNLALQQDAGADMVPVQPLHQLCAMTQGQLGSVLVRAIDRECGSGRAVCLLTHVRVNTEDPAFEDPTKPIGPFLDEEQAQAYATQRGWAVREDSGRGWRHIVPSPHPESIVEIAALRTLLKAGYIVLAAGGGGVAVHAGDLVGVDAVIDKDQTSATLATAIGATELYLVTTVPSVLLDFGTPQQRPVARLTPAEAAHHLSEGQFPPGSMGPKIAAALRFLDEGGRRVIITSASHLLAAVAGDASAGTTLERP